MMIVNRDKGAVMDLLVAAADEPARRDDQVLYGVGVTMSASSAMAHSKVKQTINYQHFTGLLGLEERFYFGYYRFERSCGWRIGEFGLQ